jgi:hypothetical protein
VDRKQILDSLIIFAEDTVDFLMPTRKWETECWVCNKFLNTLGTIVSQDDFVKPSSEPPDVIVKGANIEVFIVIENDRRLDADWRNKLNKYKSAQSLEDLLEPYRPPQKISSVQILEYLKPTLSKKHDKYTRNQVPLGKIDILAFVNLEKFMLDLETTFPTPSEFEQQGWRSVSILGNSYCRVLYADEVAPDFLRLNAGRTISIELKNF